MFEALWQVWGNCLNGVNFTQFVDVGNNREIEFHLQRIQSSTEKTPVV